MVWEYRVEEISTEQIENQLNFLGKDGWELVILEKTGKPDRLSAIMKRSKEEKKGLFNI